MGAASEDFLSARIQKRNYHDSAVLFAPAAKDHAFFLKILENVRHSTRNYL